MKRIYFKLDTDGKIIANNLEPLTQYTFQEDILQVYVPKELVENQNYTIGVIFNSIASNGSMEVQSYLIPYVREQESEGVSYMLHSRLLPKRATLYSGSQKLAFNVNFMNEDNTKCVSRITSQTFAYKVIESDYEEEVEEISDKDLLESRIAKLESNYDLKQDKVDTTIKVDKDDDKVTFINDVAEAFNTLNDKHKSNLSKIEENASAISKNASAIETNATNIGINATNIETNAGEIKNIKAQMGSYFHFLGSYEYTHSGEPTTDELDNYVSGHHDEKHIGDCVLAISTFGDQDTIYICIVTGEDKTWSIQQTSYIQKADNENFGVVKGNETEGRVSINGGQIDNVRVHYNDKWIPIDTFYNDFVVENNLRIDEIKLNASDIKTINEVTIPNEINARTQGDNNLDSRITTEVEALNKSIATKTSYQDMYDYALPRSFNDVNYFDFENEVISEELSNTTKLVDMNASTHQVDIGTFLLDNTKYYYQLSRRNNIMARLHYYNYSTNSGTLKITMNAYHHTFVENKDTLEKKEVVTQLCSYTQDFEVYNDNTIHCIEIDNTLNSLESNVISVSSNDYFTYDLFITNSASKDFILSFIDNSTYTSTLQYTCAQDPIVNLNFIDVVDEVLIFEKQGSVEDETLYL